VVESTKYYLLARPALCYCLSHLNYSVTTNPSVKVYNTMGNVVLTEKGVLSAGTDFHWD